MIKILRFIWEFPQCFIGFILSLFSEYHSEFNGIYVYKSKFNSASFGLFIFISDKNNDFEFTKRHEWGHSRWSLYLGWLYLLIIGIPSVLWLFSRKMFKKLKDKNYYWFYTEKWANESAGL